MCWLPTSGDQKLYTELGSKVIKGSFRIFPIFSCWIFFSQTKHSRMLIFTHAHCFYIMSLWNFLIWGQRSFRGQKFKFSKRFDWAQIYREISLCYSKHIKIFLRSKVKCHLRVKGHGNTRQGCVLWTQSSYISQISIWLMFCFCQILT